MMDGGLPAVAILAGGRGTRLGTRTKAVPKPIVEVAGEPFLIHLLRRLSHQGVTCAVLCVGYHGEQIERLIGNRHCGIDIQYSYDTSVRNGTLGALRQARHLLGEEFLVHYGDTLLSIDIADMMDTWRQAGTPAIMAVIENNGQWAPSNTIVRSGVIVRHSKSEPSADMRWIDYGIGGLRNSCLDDLPASESDLSALYSQLGKTGAIAAYPVSERFHEIGTPEALEETERFLQGKGSGVEG